MRLVPVSLLAILLAGPASAAPSEVANLISNPGFTTDLEGWNAEPETEVAWTDLDASGSAGSGSALLTNVTSGMPHYVKLWQCVAVEAPAVGYALRYRTRIPGGQDGRIGAWASIAAHEAAGCLGAGYSGYPGVGGGSFPSPPPQIVDEWVESPGQFLEIPPPRQVRSIRVLLVVNFGSSGGEARAHFDDVSLTPLVRMTIPASASLPGQNGAFFRTDLSLFNGSRSTARVDLSHHCLAGRECPPAVVGLDRVVFVPPRSSTVLRDVLAKISRAGTAGALELTFDGAFPVVATSRVSSSPSPGVTNGTTIPALPREAARTRSVLVPLSWGGDPLEGGFRTNVGVFNPGEAPVEVTLRLFESDGKPIGTPFSRTWAPREPFQIDDVFASLDAGDDAFEGAFLVVEATAPVFSYAIVIDEESHDATFIAGVDDSL
ncbi:MAG: hypothetical protein ACYDBY_06410 [Thermoanaerobaculia bacterium]